MLYDCWREVVRANGKAIALRDSASGRRWTFEQLGNEAEVGGGEASSPIAFPQGINADFIISVLRAWRKGQILCPLETGQAPPALLAAAGINAALPPDIAHLKTTSASTGAARIVALTGSQLKADADNIVATMGLRPEWPNLGVISLAHSYGFSNLVTPLLLHGIPLILVPAPLPESVRHASANETQITLAAVPALWRVWHEARAIPANTRLAISAGAPLPLPLESEVFNACGLKLHNFLGASECGGIAYDSTDTPRTDASCVGRPMHGVALSLNDSGCLQMRSRAVAESYWPSPDSDLGNGCFQSSDLAELRDGFVYLRGRVSDLINVAGRKISPESIERALQLNPGVRDCLVFGVPTTDADRAETIVACVAAAQGLDAELLRQFLLATLPAWQVPREWWFVDSLSANQRGKLSRTEWRKKYQSLKPNLPFQA